MIVVVRVFLVLVWIRYIASVVFAHQQITEDILYFNANTLRVRHKRLKKIIQKISMKRESARIENVFKTSFLAEAFSM